MVIQLVLRKDLKRVLILNFMEIIRNANEYHINMLGVNPVSLKNSYRFNRMLLTIDIDDGKVMLNGITRAIIFLHNSELDNIHDIKTYENLYRWYFLVPEDYNEIEEVNKIRDKLRLPIDDLYLNNVSRFTILPTLACNARCGYCYESKLKMKRNMTAETALKVSEYILQKSFRYDHIQLNWFGGEPLVNYKVIDLICNYLRTRGKLFKSDITTNGYLLNGNILKKAVENWRTTSVQITIDGTEDVYNKVKNYVNIKENAYQRIISNIKELLRYNIDVSIRLNVTPTNGENLLELVDELNAIFGARSGLHIYCRAIFESGKQRTEEENKIIYDAILKIENKLKEFEFSIGQPYRDSIGVAQCMSDDGSSVLINPEGFIGTCEHYVAEDFFGDINNSKIDYEVLNGWRDYMKDLEICKNCPVYADCLRPKKCKELRSCDRIIKEYRIHQYKEGLERLYLEYRSNNMIPSKLML